VSRKSREPCGCVHDGERWLAMCAAHQAEHQELHERAQAEYLAGQRPDPQRKPLEDAV